MDLIGTDFTKVSGMYSTFAGVLAGFVFVVIGILLNRRPPTAGEQAHNSCLSWAVVAFVGLSMSCFLFALVAGEDRYVSAATQTHPELTRIRPLVLGIIASGVFTLAVLVLFLVLIWLFKTASDQWLDYFAAPGNHMACRPDGSILFRWHIHRGSHRPGECCKRGGIFIGDDSGHWGARACER